MALDARGAEAVDRGAHGADGEPAAGRVGWSGGVMVKRERERKKERESESEGK